MTTMECSITDGPQPDDNDIEVPEPSVLERIEIAHEIADSYRGWLLDAFRDLYPHEYDQLCIQERDRTVRQSAERNARLANCTNETLAEIARTPALLRQQAD